MLLACALPAQGAPPGLRTPEDQLAALAGDDATRAAWAAHLIRGRGDRAFEKPLREALKHWDGIDAGSREVRLRLLDALIGMNASVPGPYVLPLLDDEMSSVAAFVLLAKEPRHNEPELLRLFGSELRSTRRDQPLSPRAVAIGTLLAAQRPPGFAKSLLDRVDLVAPVVVVGGDGERRRSLRWFCPDRGVPLQAELPPRPVYSFARAGGPAPAGVRRVALAAPLHDTVLRSELIAGDPEWFRLDSELRGPDPADGLTWLVAMVGHPAPPPVPELRFRDDATFVAEADAARDERQRWFDVLRERLVADGVLTADEAKPLARAVEVAIDDRRPDGSKALPRIPSPK